MILLGFEPVHIGPFSAPTVLEVERNVTVLTGSNDTGKTSLLRAIYLFCTGNKMTERELNEDRFGDFSGAWDTDPEVACNARFITDESTPHKVFTRGSVVPGDEIIVRKRLNEPGDGYQLISYKRPGENQPNNPRFTKAPNVIWLPTEGEIREVINLKEMNTPEQSLIKLAFGEKFTFENYRSVGEVRRSQGISAAEFALNEQLEKVLPKTLPLKFSIKEIGDKPDRLKIGLSDVHMGYTPFGSRGAGVRKLLSLMGALMAADLKQNHTILLFDEPETSLHADAQHMLRRMLEKLGELPTVQVIYSTHSPAMINTLTPGAIRILRRGQINDKATSLIMNNAFARNFSAVRESLGINPADSLLYAPVTVIVEGVTEVRCLPLLFKKLMDGGVKGFEDVEDLLAQIHFLDGIGDQCEYMCRLAKSQNALPVIFLDGDKADLSDKIKTAHSDAEVVMLEAGKEFEDLVPLEAYISATAKCYPDHEEQITPQRLQDWLQAEPRFKKKMRSKQIENWIDDTLEIERLNKPVVMQQAIADVAVADIAVEKLRDLLGKIRSSLVKVNSAGGAL